MGLTGAEESDTVETLAELARNGDRDAFARLYDRFAAVVHGILLAHAPAADVDDLLQEVFLTALRRLATLQEAAAFPGWICAIARHRAIDRRRRSHTEIALTDEIAAPDRSSSLDAQRALDVIQSLPEAYRETLSLRFVEGLTGPEIAERTGLSPGSVRVNLHRGMNLLRERLALVGARDGNS